MATSTGRRAPQAPGVPGGRSGPLPTHPVLTSLAAFPESGDVNTLTSSEVDLLRSDAKVRQDNLSIPHSHRRARLDSHSRVPFIASRSCWPSDPAHMPWRAQVCGLLLSSVDASSHHAKGRICYRAPYELGPVAAALAVLCGRPLSASTVSEFAPDTKKGRSNLKAVRRSQWQARACTAAPPLARLSTINPRARSTAAGSAWCCRPSHTTSC